MLELLAPLLTVAIGFAVAGMLCSFYQLLTERPPTLGLLRNGPSLEAFAGVLLLTFAAPFIFLRAVIAPRSEARQEFSYRRFEIVTLVTVVAGLWSLMSGTVLLSALEAAAFLF